MDELKNWYVKTELGVKSYIIHAGLEPGNGFVKIWYGRFYGGI